MCALCAPLLVSERPPHHPSLSQLTDAVGLQRAQLESRLAAAGVARLHRDAHAVAAYARAHGTGVDTYGRQHRLVKEQTTIALTLGYPTLKTVKSKEKKPCIPPPYGVFHGNPSCCFIGGVLDERTGLTEP